MARKARIRAISGIYYVRLNSFSPLFLQERDLTELINLLTREKETDFCEIYAYCIIDCEIHLVIKEGLSGISSNIMHFKSAFAAYYNTIYVRKGSLFNGRFYSAALENNTEVLKQVREVHRTPLRFGKSFSFEGSSYSEYFKNRPLLSSLEIISLCKTAVDFKIYTENDLESPQPTDNDNQENTPPNSLNQPIESKNNQEDIPTITPNQSTDNDNELRQKIKALLKDVTPEELEQLTDTQYKLLITRIIQLTNSTPQAVARVLEIDIEEIT